MFKLFDIVIKVFYLLKICIFQGNPLSDKCHHVSALHMLLGRSPGALRLRDPLVEADVGLGPGGGELHGAGADEDLHLPPDLLGLTSRLTAPGHHGVSLLLPGLQTTASLDVLLILGENN